MIKGLKEKSINYLIKILTKKATKIKTITIQFVGMEYGLKNETKIIVTIDLKE